MERIEFQRFPLSHPLFLADQQNEVRWNQGLAGRLCIFAVEDCYIHSPPLRGEMEPALGGARTHPGVRPALEEARFAPRVFAGGTSAASFG